MNETPEWLARERAMQGDDYKEPCAYTIEKTPLETLRELTEIQGQHGNWNYDPYMHGMYNGMELALATMEGRAPEYKPPPKEWLRGIKPEGEHAIACAESQG